MKKQVIFINWGDSKYDYENFEDYVISRVYNPKRDHFNHWSKSLKNELWDNYEVLLPEMPCRDFAEYKYWKIRFEQTFKYLKDDIIIVVHSLWWGFIVKYLNENNFPKNIKHIFMVSPTFKDWKYLLWDFNFDKKLEQFKKYENIITFYHSKDDYIVDFSDILDFQNVLPNAEYKFFEDRGHFIAEKFEELNNDILDLL